MADIAVQVAIELLTPLITSEISLISGLPEDVRAIKDELEKISAFLEIAEEKAVRDSGKKAWVKQVRNLAYDIEDVIEEYNLFLKEGTIGRLKEYMSLRVREMATTIKSIRQRALEIGSYIYENCSNNGNYQQTVTVTHTVAVVQESELVGIRNSKRELMEMLRSSKMVAVVGMRGLGKTTLVQSVYSDPRVRGRFAICAWISARRTRGSADILKSMMKQFYEGKDERYRLMNGVTRVGNVQCSYIDSMSWNSLQDLVSSYLSNKRYLLVFDNVKDGYLDKATYVKCLLSSDTNNSKIIVTTRNENVAHAWVDGSLQSIYRLKRLPQPQAWELFCKKTFQSNHGGRCPSSLHQLATGIVQRCDGLPPAILAMGRLLSTKLDDVHEWRKVYSSLGFYLEKNRHLTGIYEILISNYNDLPYNLKPCFLYFGLFPKGESINIMKLIRLWIAEDFITNDRNSLTLEEIAEENLRELISMSLVEVGDKDPTGKPKTLHIHDFLHEIILSKFQELSFCQILSEQYSAVIEKPRRLSIHKDHKPNACAYLDGIAKCKSSIRSLVVYEPSRDIFSKLLRKKFFKSVHLLKVLDLCNAPIDEIPWQVGKLRNLRYLSLRNTRVRTIPSSIGKLQELQTLDLKQTPILELPYEINELHKLRHLLSYTYEPDLSFSTHIQKTKAIKLPEGVLGNFVELQKLAFIDMRHGTSVTIDLRKLTHLRRLGIIGLKEKCGKDLCAAIELMKSLQALNVYSIDKTQLIHLNHFQSPPTTLKRLYLNGALASFPRWILELHNLVKLRLRWSNIGDYVALENLSGLPNLVELHLLEAYKGVLMLFKNEGFKRLKILQLLDLHGLESLLVHNGALPLLEELSIGESPNLQIPSGIKHLRRLKTLNFFNMPRVFTDKLQCGEEHHSIVKHVPDVLFYLKNIQGNWETYTLRRSM